MHRIGTEIIIENYRAGRCHGSFKHHGDKEGDRCFMVAYGSRAAGQGAVVMTNAEDGFQFIQDTVENIAKEYGWVAH